MPPVNFDEFPLSGLQAEGDKLDRFWMICMVTSPGIELLARSIELNYFDPKDQKKNDQFQIAIINWPDNSPLLWYLIAVPIRYRAVCEKLARWCEFSTDNTTLFVFSGGVHQFPISGPNVAVLKGNFNRGTDYLEWEKSEMIKLEFAWEMGKLEPEEVPD